MRPRRAHGGVYATLLRDDRRARPRSTLRVLVDILAGASAGGINAIFLAHAIATGQSLDPLTDLWLDSADVDALLDPGGSAMSRIAKHRRRAGRLGADRSASGTIDKTVEPGHRAEIKAKLANFVRAPWFAPPFGGPRAHQSAARRVRRDGRRGRRATRCCPTISRSTCSSPSPISTAIPSSCGSIRRPR